MSSESSSYALHVTAKASGIDSLQLDCHTQAMPTISQSEVVVQVLAAAVNPSDVKATLGIMPHAVFPRTPGRDFAGIVAAGPDALKGLKVWGSGGDIGITRNGSHARYLVLPIAAVKEVPKGISMEEAGAVGVPFVTACEGFSRAGGVKAGQTVVVLGANGKVGQAAVQIASRAELEGFACANVEVINSTHMEPATRIMDLTGGKGANLVFNTVDKVYWEVGHAVMAKGATQIFIIATKGQTVAFDLFKFYRGMHNFVGIDTLALDCVRSCELLDELRPGFEDGTLRPFPVASADMIDLPAYKEVLSGGKNRIVLKP
jgi:NADPH:quinone reductase-like Zn-dependent oxidoreductase